MKRFAVAILLAGVASVPSGRELPQLVQRDVYLMGTRASLATYASTREAGLATLEAALAVLQDTERELSTWLDESQISTLNRHPVGAAWLANARLCSMFGEVFRWRDATGGAFDPGIGRLVDAWKIHDGGAVPTGATLKEARTSSGLPLLLFDRGHCALTRTRDVTIDVGAFGKGEALDRAEAALGDKPWMIDLGGQISVGGGMPPEGGWTVSIADPIRRDRPYLTVRLTEGSLSTSGGSERDLVVEGTPVGHILDPRTGRPAGFTGSVTVWHRRGLAADALSTALYVMGPERGLRWAEGRDLAACYLIPERRGVRVAATTAFRALVAPVENAKLFRTKGSRRVERCEVAGCADRAERR